jgi:catechol 2,3-dioxygenase-like lactoylglutathione lyase family enzyme
MLPVQDVARTIQFYERLGFEVGSTHVHEGATAPDWAWMHSGRAHLMFNRAGHPTAATHQSPSIWLYAADVEATHAELRSRGLDVGGIDRPFYNPGGEFHVHDPDGYAVFVAQAE